LRLSEILSHRWESIFQPLIGPACAVIGPWISKISKKPALVQPKRERGRTNRPARSRTPGILLVPRPHPPDDSTPRLDHPTGIQARLRVRGFLRVVSEPGKPWLRSIWSTRAPVRSVSGSRRHRGSYHVFADFGPRRACVREAQGCRRDARLRSASQVSTARVCGGSMAVQWVCTDTTAHTHHDTPLRT